MAVHRILPSPSARFARFSVSFATVSNLSCATMRTPRPTSANMCFLDSVICQTRADRTSAFLPQP